MRFHTLSQCLKKQTDFSVGGEELRADGIGAKQRLLALRRRDLERQHRCICVRCNVCADLGAPTTTYLGSRTVPCSLARAAARRFRTIRRDPSAQSVLQHQVRASVNLLVAFRRLAWAHFANLALSAERRVRDTPTRRRRRPSSNRQPTRVCENSFISNDARKRAHFTVGAGIGINAI